MKICQYCNSPVPQDKNVCDNCGAKAFDYRCDQCGTVFSSPCCPRCGLRADAQARRCPRCGTSYFTAACPTCGYMTARPPQVAPSPQPISRTAALPSASPKSRTAALVLLLLLGVYGIHRFYVGKIGSGLLYLFTFGCFGIGWLVDVIMILSGSFRDKSGLPLLHW